MSESNDYEDILYYISILKNHFDDIFRLSELYTSDNISSHKKREIISIIEKIRDNIIAISVKIVKILDENPDTNIDVYLRDPEISFMEDDGSDQYTAFLDSLMEKLRDFIVKLNTDTFIIMNNLNRLDFERLKIFSQKYIYLCVYAIIKIEDQLEFINSQDFTNEGAGPSSSAYEFRRTRKSPKKSAKRSKRARKSPKKSAKRTRKSVKKSTKRARKSVKKSTKRTRK
jgi:hypothetical protein